jgi:hypothetical protein
MHTTRTNDNPYLHSASVDQRQVGERVNAAGVRVAPLKGVASETWRGVILARCVSGCGWWGAVQTDGRALQVPGSRADVYDY